jgi:hypothetical protein
MREHLNRESGDTLVWRVASTEAWYQSMIDCAPGQATRPAEISALNW